MSAQRILNSIKADIKFQLKHGFYAVYVVLSIMYVVILNFIPMPAKNVVLPILVYTDPAALGMFFIGGMVLLEKEQGVLSLLYITPLKVYEYIISKVFTLGILSTLAAVGISLAVNIHTNYILLVSGTLLSAIFYTLVGFLMASKSKTVNDYIIKIVPAAMLVILPCLTFIQNDFVPEIVNKIALFIPAAGGLKLIFGAYLPVSAIDITISLAGLIVVNILLVNKVYKVLTDKMILEA